MPLIDRIRALFGRKGDEEKKISFLAERRTALSQQRDRAYEEMANIEQQEQSLKRTFRESNAQITKKRVTTQLLQLRKDLERRQQLVGVLNQQIEVVSTHLHNLELVKQGRSAQLPDAEEMLAELEAAGEVAGTSAPSGVSGLTAEE
jgi:chromosome segregation ATPase